MSIAQLPVETLLAIAGYLPAEVPNDKFYESGECHNCSKGMMNIRAAKSWSDTNSYFRSLLLPGIFETITLCNTEESAAWVAGVSKSEQKHLVRTLRFFAHTALECYDHHTPDPALAEGVLPRKAKDILANLGCFPNLQKLVVCFDVDPEEYVQLGRPHGFYVLDVQNENEQETQSRETIHPWRTVMAKSWNAIVQNTSPHFKSLEICPFLPSPVSTYDTKAFRAFLGTMESFSLEILGGLRDYEEDVERLMSLTAPENKGFMSDNIFNHLRSVKHFTLRGTEEENLGMTENGMGRPLPLKSYHMPLLESIHIERVWICPDLVHFLIARASTLSTLSMQHCMGAIDEEGEGSHEGYEWAHLFRGLADKKPNALCRFEVEPKDLPFDGHGEDSEVDESGEDDEIEMLRELLRSEPNRRLFAYGIGFEDDGSTFYCDATVRRYFRNGDDEREYDRLMQIVEKNKIEST